MKITIFKGTLSPIYYFLLAIINITTMYRAFILDKSLASMITVILAFSGVLIIANNASHISFSNIHFILFYYLWVVFKSGTFNSMLGIISMINAFAISQTEDKNRLIRKIMENISVAGAFCVLLQQVTHLLTGIHIPFIFEPLCFTAAKLQYHSLFSTGTVSGMYRPSAFFAEPAGYACYCGVALLSLLCVPKPNIKKSIWVSMGIILTTSGMGIALTFFLWIWRYSIGNTEVSLARRIKTTIEIVIIAMAAFFILIHIPFFDQAVGRIFGSENQLGALQGRTLFWNRMFGGKSIREMILGFGPETLPEYYITGLMAVLWSYGIIGYALLVMFIFSVFLKGDNFVKMVCLIYFGLMFVAQVTSLLYTTFIFGLILSQPKIKSAKEQLSYENKKVSVS